MTMCQLLVNKWKGIPRFLGILIINYLKRKSKDHKTSSLSPLSSTTVHGQTERVLPNRLPLKGASQIQVNVLEANQQTRFFSILRIWLFVYHSSTLIFDHALKIITNNISHSIYWITKGISIKTVNSIKEVHPVHQLFVQILEYKAKWQFFVLKTS